MATFDKRRINAKTIYILKKVGRVIACYQQVGNFPNELTDRIPSDPYLDNTAEDASSYKLYYVFGQFTQQQPEEFLPVGKISNVVGTITIPWIYRDILRQTTYFDPFLNGSKFIKVGAAIDDESILIHQQVKAQYLPQSPEV